jgi:hypothetical protein
LLSLLRGRLLPLLLRRLLRRSATTSGGSAGRGRGWLASRRQISQLLLEIGLQAGAVLALEGTEFVDLLLQGSALSGQLCHDLLVLGLGIALSVVCLAAGGRHHGVGLRTRSSYYIIGCALSGC